MKRVLTISALACLALRFLFVACAAAPGSFGEFQVVSYNGAKGTLVVSNQTIHLSNAEGGETAATFACQPFAGSGQIIARIDRFGKTQAKAGLFFCETTNAMSRYAGIFLDGGNIVFERLPNTNEPAISTVKTNTAADWLRIVREGDALSGFYSADGSNWIQIGADTIELPESAFAGFELFGSGGIQVEQFQVTSADLKKPVANSKFIVPTNILLATEITASADAPAEVEFFSDAEKIGEAVGFPYTAVWSNAFAGEHLLTAKVTDSRGESFFVAPIGCKIELPPTKVEFVGIDETTRGNWIGKYGAEGFHIIEHATNYPAYAKVSSSGHKSALVLYDSKNPGALQFTNNANRVAAHWHTYTNMTWNLSLLDGRPHQVAVYCQDWGHDNERIEDIEVRDAVTKRLLDKRRIARFTPGKYAVWDIQGAVQFRITTIAAQAVISGLFFDPVSP